jgi:hypothetical protein
VLLAVQLPQSIVRYLSLALGIVNLIVGTIVPVLAIVRPHSTMVDRLIPLVLVMGMVNSMVPTIAWIVAWRKAPSAVEYKFGIADSAKTLTAKALIRNFSEYGEFLMVIL